MHPCVQSWQEMGEQALQNEELRAGQVEGGNVLGCVSEWDQSREFTVHLPLRLLAHQHLIH